MQNDKLILIVYLEETLLVYFERLICKKNKFMFIYRSIIYKICWYTYPSYNFVFQYEF